MASGGLLSGEEAHRHIQMIHNLPQAGLLHQDSKGGSSGEEVHRHIHRVHVLLGPDAAVEAVLGCLALTRSSSGAGGGVLLELGRCSMQGPRLVTAAQVIR